MKRGMTKADKKVTQKNNGGLATTLLKVVGVGLAAGAALIAVTDKTMKKAFPEEAEKEKTAAEPEGCTECAEASEKESTCCCEDK